VPSFFFFLTRRCYHRCSTSLPFTYAAQPAPPTLLNQLYIYGPMLLNQCLYDLLLGSTYNNVLCLWNEIRIEVLIYELWNPMIYQYKVLVYQNIKGTCALCQKKNWQKDYKNSVTVFELLASKMKIYKYYALLHLNHKGHAWMQILGGCRREEMWSQQI
jgi:hypothetical protein